MVVTLNGQRGVFLPPDCWKVGLRVERLPEWALARVQRAADRGLAEVEIWQPKGQR